MRSVKFHPRLTLWPALASMTMLLGCQGAPQESGVVPADPRKLESETARVFVNQVVECMNERGVPAEAIADGEGIEYQSKPGFEAASDTVYETCVEESGGEPTAAPLDEDEMSRMYRQLLGVRGCLAAAGYESPEPPTEEVFIAQYGSAGNDQRTILWTPYPSEGGIVNRAALEDCPTPDLFER